MTEITTDTTEFERAQNGTGLLIPISEEVTQAIGLQPGDEYQVEVVNTGGTVEVEITFPDHDITAEQEQLLAEI